MTGNMAAVLPSVLSDLTNQERQTQNLPVLIVSPKLNEAAQMKANDMATKGYFSHTSPDGKTPWYWLEQVGYNYQYAGENLAVNFTDSKDVTDAWMASPEHRANIVKGNYTEVGTGVASGMYQGREAIFVAQDYANPMPVVTTPVVTTTPAVPIKTTSTAVDTTASKTTAATIKIVTTKEPANVLGAEAVANIPTIPAQQPTFWQKLLASPRNTTNIILYIASGIILFALLLYVLMKKINFHIDLITNGLIVLAVIGAMFVTNYYLTHHNMVITQSLDYANQSE